MDLEIGKVYEVVYPFMREIYTSWGEDGSESVDSWRPGHEEVQTGIDECDFMADGQGQMLLTIIDIHKPGKYPTRIFYTRKWRDPDGKEFGLGKLHITTKSAFERRATGYMYPFKVKPSKEPVIND